MSYPPFVVDNLRKTVDNLGWGCAECIFVIPYVGDKKLRRLFLVMGLTRYRVHMSPNTSAMRSYCG